MEIDPKILELGFTAIVSIMGSMAMAWRFLIQKAKDADAAEREKLERVEAELETLKKSHAAQALQIDKLIDANKHKDSKIKDLESDLLEWKLKYAGLEASRDTLQQVFNTVLENAVNKQPQIANS